MKNAIIFKGLTEYHEQTHFCVKHVEDVQLIVWNLHGEHASLRIKGKDDLNPDDYMIPVSELVSLAKEILKYFQ